MTGVIVAGSGNVTGHGVISALRLDHAVIGYDSCDAQLNPAVELCNNFTVPRASDPEYMAAVMRLIEVHKPKTIIPSNDHDLRTLIAMQHALRAEDVTLNGLGDHTLTFLDKRRTSKLFTELGITTPELLGTLDTAPMIVRKQLVGMGKKFTHLWLDPTTPATWITNEDFAGGVMTRYVEGKEFTIDILCDQRSNVLSVVPRLRHEVRNGMVHYAEVVKDDFLIVKSTELAQKLELTGVNCAQCIRTDADAYFFEVNPRPGSGMSLTTHAGVNMPQLWMMSLTGKKFTVPEPDWGLKMVRYYEGHYFK